MNSVYFFKTHSFKWLCLIGVLVLLDQASKLYVLSHLKIYESFFVTPFLNWVHVINTGSLFGLFSSLVWANKVLAVLGVLVGGYAIYCIIRQRMDWPARMAFTCLGSGAIGNTVDRFLHGHVVDWIDLHVGYSHWPAFNVADISINIALVFFVYCFLTKRL